MVARVFTATAEVVIVNGLEIVAPAGTVTVAGGMAACCLLLVSVTTAPPDPAGAESVIVFAALAPPPPIVVGESVNPLTVAVEVSWIFSGVATRRRPPHR